MKIVLISDTHNRHGKLNLPAGDVLIHCGDFTNLGMLREIRVFGDWMSAQNGFAHKIVIAGNHDWEFERRPRLAIEELLSLRHVPHDIIYLQDTSVTLHVKNRQIRIYGSPWQPNFHNWAFNLSDDQRSKIWSNLPHDIDILITHGPPFGILDMVVSGEHVGCKHLLENVKRVKPRLHAFGHIHEAYGLVEKDEIIFANAAVCSSDYSRLNEPVVIEI